MPETTSAIRLAPVVDDPMQQAWTSLSASERARFLDRAEGRLEEIKPYQLSIAALTAFAGSAINGSGMGAGKTFMAIFHAFLLNVRYVALIMPRRLFPTWLRALQQLKMEAVTIESAPDARHLSARIYKERRAGNRPPEPVFALISTDWLCLGGIANQAFDPWTAFIQLSTEITPALLWLLKQLAGGRSYDSLNKYDLNDRRLIADWFRNLTPQHAETMLTAARSRDEQAAIQARDTPPNLLDPTLLLKFADVLEPLFTLSLNDHHARTAAFEAQQIPPQPTYDWSRIAGYYDEKASSENMRFTGPTVGITLESYSAEKIVNNLRSESRIPFSKQQSYRYEQYVRKCPRCNAAPPDWTGLHCTECLYTPHSYRTTPHTALLLDRDHKQLLRIQGEATSNRSYPGYKILPRFDLKVIDEFHKVTSTSTLHGTSIFDVHAQHTLLLSGTICRTYLSELEAALALVHDQNSPEFPYARHEFTDFHARFQSKQIVARYQQGRSSRRSTNIPEASNVNGLRRLLHGRLAAADQATIDASWNLPDPEERPVRYTLDEDTWQQYQLLLRSVLAWRNDLVERSQSRVASERQQANAELLRGAHNRIDLLHHLVFAAKALAATRWARQQIREGHRSVIVCRSRKLFQIVAVAFKHDGIRFSQIDETISSDKRDQALEDFADSGNPILLTRIKLVCEGFNQLVCCNRLLFVQVEHSPSDNRQMIKRLCRPGLLTQDIRTDYLVCLLPDGRASLDEVEINNFLRKERAIKEVLEARPRFISAAIIYSAAQQARGVLRVLDDLAAQVMTEFKPEDLNVVPAFGDDGVPPAASIPPTNGPLSDDTTAAGYSPPSGEWLFDMPLEPIKAPVLELHIDGGPNSPAVRSPRATPVPRREKERSARQYVQTSLFD